MITRYATTEQIRQRRRGKRDRLALGGGPLGPASAAPQRQPTRTDPDYDLIHAYRPEPTKHRSRRKLLQNDNLAFASINSSQYTEKTQHAGVSSAAACIVLELPTMKPLRTTGGSTRRPPSVELLSNNRKKRTPVSDREVQKWRGNSSSKACYRFKPVYTHQFFTDENIQGYRPNDGAIEESRSVARGVNEIHPSFSHSGIAGHTLSIQVRLAPSCRKCCLILEVTKVNQPSNINVDSSGESLVAGRRAKSQKSRKGASATAEEAACALLRKVSISSLSDGGDGDDEDDEDEYKLKNNQGGRKKRRRGNDAQNKQSMTTTSVLTTSTRRSRRKRGQVGQLDSLQTIDEVEVVPSGGVGRRKCVKRIRPTQSKRLLARQVTDVSDSPSSDEEVESPSSSGSVCRSFSLSSIASSTIITQVSAGLPDVAAVLLKDDSVLDGSNNFKIVSSSVNSIADIENDYLNEPIGDVIREYSREKTNMDPCGSGGIPSIEKGGSRKSSNGNFVLTLADMRTDKDARKYHDEVEKISRWFIEIASCVEVGMSGGVEAGGYWKVLYLFEKHRHGARATMYSLVGYVTLFYHGLQMTVCQAVCLPPYQRSGHGTEMLRAAYAVCETREILVESPAPAFVALRNRLDYALVSGLIEQAQVFPRQFTRPTHDVLVKVGSELHITPHQVETAYEIWMLGELGKSIQNTVNINTMAIARATQIIASMEATYKAMVKRSLLKTLRGNQELNFDAMVAEEQREHLEQCFNGAVVRYRSILK